MGKTQIPYPPCEVNLKTGKPYVRHSWEIKPGRLAKRGSNVLFYHVACSRCGFNDPAPPTY
jgi:hypothetical protein